MSYDPFILKRAQRELSQLPNEDYARVKDAIRRLGESPRPSAAKKLRGRAGWRIRVGNYRVIYELQNEKKIVIVLHVGLRRNVYER